MGTQPHTRPVFSVVVPMFDEAEIIGDMHRRLAASMATLDAPWEVIYVNDGSRDTTIRMLEALQQADHHVALVNLSRNFGVEIATTAGLDHARGDAVIVMDADLQDLPEVKLPVCTGLRKLVWHSRSRLFG
jgi:polyisoprenyl-phosphate glycosyltransferase